MKMQFYSNFSGDPDKIIDEGAYINQKNFNVPKQPYIRKDYLKFSWPERRSQCLVSKLQRQPDSYYWIMELVTLS
jgi:hypothetical protein